MQPADDALEDRQTSEDVLDAVHERALRRFDDSVLPQIEMREAALQARRFVSIPGAQWEGAWGEQFENSIRVEVPKVRRGVLKIENDYRQNRIVPDFRPSGGESDQGTADTLDGVHRADSHRFKAQQARDNAFSEAVRGGFGAYRLTNQLLDPYDKDSDEQCINPGLAITDADQRVFFDANAVLYDKSDARFAFVLTDMTADAFAETYGDDRLSSWPEGLPRLEYDQWFKPDTVLVCEYYEAEEPTETVIVLTEPLSATSMRLWAKDASDDQLADYAAKGWERRDIRRKRRRVRKYVMTGAEVLRDAGYIAGDCIPIVPVYGNREFVDGVERFTGHVQHKMDTQRLYNAKVSKLAEIDALAPMERPIFAPEQMPPAIAAQWGRMNIERHPFALAQPLLNAGGDIVSAGAIGKVEAPRIPETAAALLDIANRDLIEDDQDGADQVKANTSAEAMDIAAARVDSKSGIYLDNMRQSVQREGEIYLSMAGDVYFEAGRIIETMSEDGDDGEAELSESYRMTNGAMGTRNDFAKGRYKVVADVTEATATRRDKTVKRCLEAAEICITGQDMEGAQALIGTAMLNADGEGMNDIREWWRKRMVVAGVVQPNQEEREQMEAQARQTQPDPGAVVAEAQAEALQAGAEKDRAQVVKLSADTELARAKTTETLVGAGVSLRDALTPPVVQPQGQATAGL